MCFLTSLLFAFVLFPSMHMSTINRGDDGAVELNGGPTRRSDLDCSLCGYTEFGHSLVINGKEVTPLYKYPWVVPIMDDSTGFIRCSGAVISRTFIITAAHCIFEQWSPGLMLTTDALPAVTLETCSVFIPPDFIGPMFGKDIALIQLAQPLKCDMYTRPICLPRAPMCRKDNVTIAGYGTIFQDLNKLPGKDYTAELREGKVREVDPKECKISYENDKKKIFCTKGLDNQTSCRGDSGSSVFGNFDGVFYSLGITSMHSNALSCPVDEPVTHTNTFAYMDWIQTHVKDLPIPPQRISDTEIRKLVQKNM